MHLKHPYLQVTKKFKMILLAGKVMLIVFGIYIGFCCPISNQGEGILYCEVLGKLHDVIHQKCLVLMFHAILHHHDNAKLHTTQLMMAEVEKLQWRY